MDAEAEILVGLASWEVIPGQSSQAAGKGEQPTRGVAQTGEGKIAADVPKFRGDEHVPS